MMRCGLARWLIIILCWHLPHIVMFIHHVHCWFEIHLFVSGYSSLIVSQLDWKQSRWFWWLLNKQMGGNYYQRNIWGIQCRFVSCWPALQAKAKKLSSAVFWGKCLFMYLLVWSNLCCDWLESDPERIRILAPKWHTKY